MNGLGGNITAELLTALCFNGSLHAPGETAYDLENYCAHRSIWAGNFDSALHPTHLGVLVITFARED
jgi:hypothetical protein